jgi:F-type H+-transporting ATPase subunit epsilon
MAMAEKIPFDLVSPERLLLSGEAEMITLPGSEGYFGVGIGHAPIISTLKPGMIDIKAGPKGDERYFVMTGFAEVTNDKATILAEEVLPIASLSLKDVEGRLKDAHEDVLQAKSEATRQKAVATLNALQLLETYLSSR